MGGEEDDEAGLGEVQGGKVPLPPPHARPKSPKPLPLTMQAVVFGLGLGYLHSRYSSIFGRKRRGYQRIGEAQRDL